MLILPDSPLFFKLFHDDVPTLIPSLAAQTAEPHPVKGSHRCSMSRSLGVLENAMENHHF